MKHVVVAISLILSSLALCAFHTLYEEQKLSAEINSLRVPDHYWHRIKWRKSLAEGLAESARSHKPIFIWAFIDYPDEERC